MQETIIYRTSYLKDKYEIFKADLNIGKLYKGSWIGSATETTINGRKFKFHYKGFIKPIVTIYEKDNAKQLGEAKLPRYPTIRPIVVLTMANNRKYKWAAKGWISSKWQWTDLESAEVVMNAHDQSKVFEIHGSIMSSAQSKDEELLIGLGLHLRTAVPRVNRTSVLLGALILLLFLPRLF